MKKKTKVILVVSLIIAIFLIGLNIYNKAGIFQLSNIDERDLAYWNYENGFIQGTEAFEVEGSKETCWLMIHSYAATPLEMKEISSRVSEEFGDYIYVPRLQGHGETPSQIMNLTLKDWYLQVENEFDKLDSQCDKINVLGSSFGGALTLKLAEEKDANNIYLVNAYLKTAYRWYWIVPLDFYLNLVSDTFLYTKKSTIAQINSPDGLEHHIAYWNFPFQPVKNSFEFLEIVRTDIDKVEEPVLVLHSIGDRTADIKIMEEVYESFSNENKSFVEFEDSNHILLIDFDKEETINKIIEFEKQNRK